MAKQKSDFKIPEGQLIAQLSITEKEFSILLLAERSVPLRSIYKASSLFLRTTPFGKMPV